MVGDTRLEFVTSTMLGWIKLQSKIIYGQRITVILYLQLIFN